MSWTKRELITAAFEEIGIASYTFDLSSAQLQSALQRLDAMIAAWNAKGIRLGYPLPSGPTGSNLNDDSNLPDSANAAVFLNLAVSLAPSYGKVVMPETKAMAKDYYNTLLNRAAMPQEMQLPHSMPLGAGNKGWRFDEEFTGAPADPVLTGPEGPLEF